MSTLASLALPDGGGWLETGASTVRLRRVAKRYGARQVLTDFDFEVERGSFVAVVGRSGCGKSTLLRLLAGLDAADRGALTVDDAAPGSGATRMVFPEARLLPWKTVLQNVLLGLPAWQRDDARDALADVGLADRAHAWPAQLSSGQRQRVALARALVHRPRLLLLDEPFGALDAVTRIDLQTLIERLWRAHGFTAVLATHDVQTAAALADRVVLIDGGRIAFDRRVPFARPRARGDAAFAAFEDAVLQRVLSSATPDAASSRDAAAAPAFDAGRLRWAR